ncbi:MAG: DMT family transporter [Solidesulfovibrio sp.]
MPVISSSATRLVARCDLSFAVYGLFLALGSGMLWGLNGVVLDVALHKQPFADPSLWLVAPLTASAMHDALAGGWNLLYNAGTGRIREIGRSLCTRPGLLVCLGALFGGPLGMGGYVVGLKLAGPAFVLPLTSLYPAVASGLALLFLKERIVPRAWIGLACCACGVAVMSWTPPEGATGSLFYLGLGMAGLATVGWGAEGVLSTSAMDLLDPAVALNLRQLVSGIIYLFVLLPLLGGWPVLARAVTAPGGAVILGASAIGATSYLLWYRAMNMTGVSRAMAVNVTYALWGILFSALFTDVDVTMSLCLGAVVIVVGMLLVVGDPRRMADLRNIDEVSEPLEEA